MLFAYFSFFWCIWFFFNILLYLIFWSKLFRNFRFNFVCVHVFLLFCFFFSLYFLFLGPQGMLPSAMPSSLNNNNNSTGGQGNGNSVVSSERVGGGIASIGQKSQGGMLSLSQSFFFLDLYKPLYFSHCVFLLLTLSL